MTAPRYDVAAFRRQFPALESGTAHFDGPGGSQIPRAVADAVAATMTTSFANRGTVTAAERFTDGVVVAARAAAADLLGADPAGIVFGRSMTALTFQFADTLARTWSPGDEIVVSRLDHDANVTPWALAAQAAGATVRWIDFDTATGELTEDHVRRVISSRTRLVAVTGASNLIGTRPPLRAIADAVHAVGALFFVDGVHLTAHAPVDVVALGADLFACSPYKFLGPHCGIVAGSPELLAGLRPAKLTASSDAVPERFELGTLPYELLAGTTAAIEVLAGLGGADGTRRERLIAGMTAVERHEDELREGLEAELAALPGVTSWSRAAERTPTLLITFTGRDARDAHRFLAERNVNAPAGSFYALEPSRALGLGTAGGLRIGLAPYSDAQDVQRLLTGLREFLA
ncbi:cysteine desulfurase-like protein [Nakamurella flavida]|uniref:Cysteine desulfurase-like protein n=1 Tax=Nakamurella flavida TaxID=363630 RepID=A0A938YHH0_9ACTN|nr:cysteine desulfurase-like protein [Nakamurella flavida]MBM9476002.1 cysteine desulfurase-like protein [Nakamurella flavida]MDP9777255.1 cysteine desulfurase family protein (TIGR01976 family) [Nakamurella flavida]